MEINSSSQVFSGDRVKRIWELDPDGISFIEHSDTINFYKAAAAQAGALSCFWWMLYFRIDWPSLLIVSWYSDRHGSNRVSCDSSSAPATLFDRLFPILSLSSPPDTFDSLARAEGRQSMSFASSCLMIPQGAPVEISSIGAAVVISNDDSENLFPDNTESNEQCVGRK